MKAFTRFTIYILVIFVIFSPGCSKKTDDKITFGEFSNGKYSNSFFNLKLSIPEAWYVMDDETRITLMQQGDKILSNDKENEKSDFNISELNNVNLLTASKHALGVQSQSNPSFMIFAEKINHLAGIKKGRDFHNHIKNLMDPNDSSVSFSDVIVETRVDGIPFDILKIEINLGNTKNMQKQYVTISNGYALLLILTYQDDNGLKALEKIITTINFQG